jgi:hypothetical protein
VSDKNSRRDVSRGRRPPAVCQAASRGERGDVPVPGVSNALLGVSYSLLGLSYALLPTRPVVRLTIVSWTT